MRASPLVALLSLALACAGPAEGEPQQPPPAAASPSAELEGPAPAEAKPETPGADPSLCVIVDELASCAGQRVELRGEAAKMVMQHPMINQPEGLSPDNRNTQQGYIDAHGRQIIVLTAEPFACTGPMRVVGTLEAVDLGGEAGTKDSYSGWSVRDALVTCE